MTPVYARSSLECSVGQNSWAHHLIESHFWRVTQSSNDNANALKRQMKIKTKSIDWVWCDLNWDWLICHSLLNWDKRVRSKFRLAVESTTSAAKRLQWPCFGLTLWKRKRCIRNRCSDRRFDLFQFIDHGCQTHIQSAPIYQHVNIIISQWTVYVCDKDLCWNIFQSNQ